MHRNSKFFSLILVLIVSVGFNFNEFDGNSYMVFNIKQGRHFSLPVVLSPFFDHKIQFRAKFDQSAEYAPQSVEMRGVNKLYGFSDCNSAHHINGARFGWEWYNNELQISAYVYANKIRKFEFMTAVPLNAEITYTIDTIGDQYLFKIEGPNLLKTLTMKRGCSGDGGVKYKNGPYFGGKSVAPHDIKILIDELKY